jgi:hypothetical protein
MCRNVWSIEWHQKTYHEISWDYPFKANGIPPNAYLKHFFRVNVPLKPIVSRTMGRGNIL